MEAISSGNGVDFSKPHPVPYSCGLVVVHEEAKRPERSHCHVLVRGRWHPRGLEKEGWGEGVRLMRDLRSRNTEVAAGMGGIKGAPESLAWQQVDGVPWAGASVGDEPELRLVLSAALEEPSTSSREDGMYWISAAGLDFNLFNKYLHSTFSVPCTL